MICRCSEWLEFHILSTKTVESRKIEEPKKERGRQAEGAYLTSQTSCG